MQIKSFYLKNNQMWPNYKQVFSLCSSFGPFATHKVAPLVYLLGSSDYFEDPLDLKRGTRPPLAKLQRQFLCTQQQIDSKPIFDFSGIYERWRIAFASMQQRELLLGLILVQGAMPGGHGGQPHECVQNCGEFRV